MAEPILHAESKGEGKAGALPLVLLHGFGGHAGTWRRVADSLAPQIQTIAFDLPGHGRSLEGPGVGGAGRIARAILADLDGRGITRAHFSGHSLGGAVASIIALKAPERTASLTLLAPGGFGSAINHRLIGRYMRARDPETMRAALEGMSGFNSPVERAEIDEILSSRAHGSALEGLEAVYAALFSGEDGARVQGTLPIAELAALPIPKQVLWGDQDAVLPVAQALALPAGFRVTILEGAGHMLIAERESEVTAALRETVSTSSEDAEAL